MSLSIRVFGGLALAASLACLSTAALAQAAGGAGPDRAPPTAEQREAWKQQHETRRREALEEQARRLHDILNLRPDQDAALHAFLTSMAPPRREDMRRERPDEAGKLTTPQRLDRMAQRLAERQTEFQTRAAAIRQFYAALSPEQQRAFDALPPRMDGERPGGPRGPGEWGHPGEWPGGMGPGEPGGPGAPH
jgi:hypothetical protein